VRVEKRRSPWQDGGRGANWDLGQRHRMRRSTWSSGHRLVVVVVDLGALDGCSVSRRGDRLAMRWEDRERPERRHTDNDDEEERQGAYPDEGAPEPATAPQGRLGARCVVLREPSPRHYTGPPLPGRACLAPPKIGVIQRRALSRLEFRRSTSSSGSSDAAPPTSSSRRSSRRAGALLPGPHAAEVKLGLDPTAPIFIWATRGAEKAARPPGPRHQVDRHHRRLHGHDRRSHRAVRRRAAVTPDEIRTNADTYPRPSRQGRRTCRGRVELTRPGSRP